MNKYLARKPLWHSLKSGRKERSWMGRVVFSRLVLSSPSVYPAPSRAGALQSWLPTCPVYSWAPCLYLLELQLSVKWGKYLLTLGINLRIKEEHRVCEVVVGMWSRLHPCCLSSYLLLPAWRGADDSSLTQGQCHPCSGHSCIVSLFFPLVSPQTFPPSLSYSVAAEKDVAPEINAVFSH